MNCGLILINAGCRKFGLNKTRNVRVI